MAEIDLRAAINAVSDVVQNRPLPLREFDQIYMKTGDMVMQSEFVSRWASGKRLAFVGDGDAISVCVAYLNARGILDAGPDQITVFDFDERVVNAVRRFASDMQIDSLTAELYNCVDPIPDGDRYDLFYTNPPWGASNGGDSVNLFARRGFELTAYRGAGIIVIADGILADWSRDVLSAVQRYGLDSGYFVSRMTPQLHSYHLDDAPDLRSCNLILSSLRDEPRRFISESSSRPELDNFYGRNNPLRVRYVRDLVGRDRSAERMADYKLEMVDD